MKEEDLFFIEKVCELAEKSVEQGGGPFGACIVDQKGNIIGEGRNQVTEKKDPTLHAEIVAIKDACHNLNHYSLSGCIIYSSCEPCPMCLSAIYWARLDKIVYANSREDAKSIGFDDSFIYDEVSKSNEERKIPTLPIHLKERKKAFMKWSEKTDKTEY